MATSNQSQMAWRDRDAAGDSHGSVGSQGESALAAPTRGFEDSEFEQRLLRAQRYMAEVGMDALLLTTEPEFRYFTGFLTQFWLSPTRPWFLVVPQTGRPIAVVPEIGGPLLQRTWISDIVTWPSPQPKDEGVSLLASTLQALLGHRAVIGLPMGPETILRMPLADFADLKAALPRHEFTDATDVVKALRMVKSEAEIAKTAHICDIASRAFAAVPELATPGKPLSSVFRDFKITLLREGADDVPYLVGAAAQGGYDNVIAPPDDRGVEDGDILMMDTGATFDGYYCDFDRNFAIGRADTEAIRAYDTLYRATEAAFEKAIPGNTTADLFQAMQDVIVRDGYACGNVGRLGHGLGMQLTEWPSHTISDRTALQSGMVLTLEPALWIGPGRSMVHEENLVVREHAAQYLSHRAAPYLPELG